MKPISNSNSATKQDNSTERSGEQFGGAANSYQNFTAGFVKYTEARNLYSAH